MRQLFLDCDGVLADFDGAGEKLWGMPPRAYEAKVGANQFWEKLKNATDFYGTLAPMKDAYDLYSGCIQLGYTPKILTGLPLGDWAERQKRTWGAKHFPDVEMICCMSKDERNHMQPGDILIDDYLKYRDLWVDSGGIFIHHTSAGASLDSLMRIGPPPV